MDGKKLKTLLYILIVLGLLCMVAGIVGLAAKISLLRLPETLFSAVLVIGFGILITCLAELYELKKREKGGDDGQNED